MFCPKCGKDNKEGSKFCEACGAVIEAAAPVSETPIYTPAYDAAPTPEATPGYGYAPVPPKKTSGIAEMVTSVIGEVKGYSKQAYMKVISVMLAVLTIATMLMGWTKITNDEDIPMVDLDVGTTFNVFQFTRINAMLEDAIDEAEDMAGAFGEDGMPKEVKKANTKVTITQIIMIFGMIAIYASLLLLAAYIFLSLINSKSATFVGMISSLTTVAAVLFFIIAFCVFHSLLSIGPKQMDVMIDKFVTFRLTVPVFLTLFAAAGNFVLMMFKRSDIQA